MRTYLGEFRWGWFFDKQWKEYSEGGMAGDPY